MGASDPLADVPPPSPEALAHSQRVAAHIKAEIEATEDGRLGFDRYMELALYAPGLGYYSAGAHKFGADGDFVTAPEISPLFSRCLARQCAGVLEQLGGGDILELGAGSGVMAADMLAELEALGQLPRRYLILELSGDLRQRQQALLAERVPALAERVEWLDRLPEVPLNGIILGNEVLDALPVKRVMRSAHGWRELCAGIHGDKLIEVSRELDDSLAGVVAQLPEALPEGYQTEINTGLAPWLASLIEVLDEGLMLWLDYGLPRAEYYHPQRFTGTLRCHYRHRAHNDPWRWPGLQDITAWVDFSAVAEATTQAGLTLIGYTTQANFLLGGGLDVLAAEALQDPGAGESEAETRQRLDMASQIKRLTLPSEMGEAFKVIGFATDPALSLPGFALRDLADRL